MTSFFLENDIKMIWLALMFISGVVSAFAVINGLK